jgi:hypothetical protein
VLCGRRRVPFACRPFGGRGVLAVVFELAEGAPAFGDPAVDGGVAGAGDVDDLCVAVAEPLQVSAWRSWGLIVVTSSSRWVRWMRSTTWSMTSRLSAAGSGCSPSSSSPVHGVRNAPAGSVGRPFRTSDARLTGGSQPRASSSVPRRFAAQPRARSAVGRRAQRNHRCLRAQSTDSIPVRACA